MTTTEILNEAFARRCTFTLRDPDGLHVSAPKGTLTAKLVADLRQRKHEIRCLLLLRQSTTSTFSKSARVAPTAELVHPPSGVLRQPGLRARVSSAETLQLIAWLKESLADLPREPFQLAPWLKVTDPAKFFDRLLFEAGRYPDGDRPVGLGADLALLKAAMDARQAKGRTA